MADAEDPIPPTEPGLSTPSETSSKPDVMNDPDFSPQPKTSKASEELDTCRICRGESTPVEPLFHPCKCSGSIKFVHQECLMEWLTHSQKKHCELCKTSFRFTKLYHPHMPNTLPTLLFLRRAAIHIVNALISWCRGVLVMSVWTIWLPWSMRFVWSGLFWLGDGGWAKDIIAMKLGGNVTHEPGALSPSSNATTISSTSLLRMMQGPLTRELLTLFGWNNKTNTAFPPSNATDSNSTLTDAPLIHRRSLLSSWSFLQDITPNQGFNKFVLDTMEGQIITLSVVTGFILVFLIREWVVQQQPALNLGAFHDEPANNAAQPNPNQAGGQEANATEQDANQAPTGDTAAPQDSGLQPLTAASLRMAADDPRADSLHVSELSITNTINDLRNCADNLKNIAQSDFAGPEVDQQELREAQDAVLQVRLIYLKLRAISKSALDTRNTSDARWALDRLSQLQEALTYLPWTDDKEMAEMAEALQMYMDTAYQLLTVQEDFLADRSESIALPPDATTSTQDVSSDDRQEGDSSAIEPTLDLSLINSSSRDREDPSADLAVRPTMPDRIQSSIATNIKRDLEESQDSNVPPALESQKVGAERVYVESISISSVLEAAKEEVSEDQSHQNFLLNPLRRKQKSDNLANNSVTPGPQIPTSDEANESSHDSKKALELDQVMSSTPSDYIMPTLQSSSSVNQPRPSMLATSESSGNLSAISDVADAGSSTANHDESGDVEPDPHAFDQVDERGLHLPGDDDDDDDHDDDDDDTTDDSETVSLDLNDPAHAPIADNNILHRLLDWTFGDLAAVTAPATQQGNAEHVVQDMAAEAPFVPFHDNQPDLHADHEHHEEQAQVGDALAAAQAANVAQDAEAVEDAEDLEGILELIGMQGPLAGLFQNAVFAAVLVSATIGIAILLPYICGKAMFVVLANPISFVNLPLLVISSAMNSAIDLCILVVASLTAWLEGLLHAIMSSHSLGIPGLKTGFTTVTVGKACRKMADAALLRIVEAMFPTSEHLEAFKQGPLMYNSLSSLRTLQTIFQERYTDFENWTITTYELIASLQSASTPDLCGHLIHGTRVITLPITKEITGVVSTLTNLPSLLRTGRLVLNISNPYKAVATTQALERWSISDRVTAIITGYITLAMAGALYVKRGAPFSTSEQGRKIENIAREVFLQSAGVLKVILIIGIEMLVFPLYCGFLLDTAMLPLFSGSSIASRISFTKTSFYTSIFFHWFIGTCYMFHFALYVAMCRRIFRKGVLYFIRDPDDPNFHPVRDVLERSVSSQLRKIGFSACVYGALVIFCMGSVVWAVAYGVSGILPIKWTGKDSYFGYPIDLLLYNFLAPVALHVFRPSKGLQTVYEWWFKRSARLLRLSHFLFNDSKDDESEADDDESGLLSGRFVRAPASDHIRIPRGRQVFLRVDKDNNRLDNQPEPEGNDEAHAPGNEQYRKVWLPPSFKLRVCGFVFLMWMLTAILGLSATVLPLTLGRTIMSSLTDFPTNDLYNYFAGAAPLALTFCSRSLASLILSHLHTVYSVSTTALASLQKTTLQTLRILYVYGALTLLATTLLATILECYIILPLQSYTSLPTRTAAPHTVYLIQDWTMALMYLRIILRIILAEPDSRLARGLNAVVARGWLDPDARMATRCFFKPFVVLAGVAICLPSAAAYLLTKSYIMVIRLAIVPQHLSAFGIAQSEVDGQAEREKHLLTQATRFSYPLLLALCLAAVAFTLVKREARKWRMRIRDEIYLIGQRLHNFGEGRDGGGVGAGALDIDDVNTGQVRTGHVSTVAPEEAAA